MVGKSTEFGENKKKKKEAVFTKDAGEKQGNGLHWFFCASMYGNRTRC